MVLSAGHVLSVEPLGSVRGDCGRAYRIKLPVSHLDQPNVIRFTTGLHQFNSILIHIQIKQVRCEPVVNWLVWHTERQSPLPDYTRSNQP